MAALRALSGLAFVLVFGAAGVPHPQHIIVEEADEDAVALVQVGAESRLKRRLESGLESSLEQLRGLPIPRRRKTEFPLTDNTHGFPAHFLASASFTMDVFGFHVHCFDIAMYLKSSSGLWNPTGRLTRDERLDRMLGNTFFEYILMSRWMNNKNTAQATAEALLRWAKDQGVQGYEQPIKEYEQAFLNGGKLSKGSHITVIPNRQGLHPVVAGQDMGVVKSDLLGRLLIDFLMGNESTMPEFRDAVFAQLSDGKPSEVGLSAEVHAQGGSMAWAIVIAVVIAIVVASAVGCGCWCCVKRYRASAATVK